MVDAEEFDGGSPSDLVRGEERQRILGARRSEAAKLGVQSGDGLVLTVIQHVDIQRLLGQEAPGVLPLNLRLDLLLQSRLPLGYFRHFVAINRRHLAIKRSTERALF